MSATESSAGFGALLGSLGGGSTDLIAQVLAAVKEHVGADMSFLAEFRGDVKIIRRIIATGTPSLVEGICLPLEATYCSRVVCGKLPNLILDARSDPRVRDLPITAELDIGSYLSVAVTLPDGRVFGTLCCIRHEADPSLDQRDVRFMRVLGDLIGTQLGRDEAARSERAIKSERIGQWLDGGPRMVFQPIVSLATGLIVGAEALARFEAEPSRSPDRWFAEAWDVGMGLELEVVALRNAIGALDQLPLGAYLTVNASPATLLSDAFAAAVLGVPRNRLVVEVTEHAMVEAYEPLVNVVKRLGAQGIRVAIDDAGAGYAGLCHIIQVAPKLLKLDLMLSRDVHADLVKQALVSAVVGFGLRAGVDIVAEGVENAEDANTLRRLGVPYGQGFHFARPGAMPAQLELAH
ncbi:MAG: EAL domain-containing protein [Pseudomonadota bacterium]|nr:EAL domain-containing protein [Pseudomonadota bacterium]